LMVEAQNTAEMKEPDEVGHGATREASTAVPPLPQRSGNGNQRVKASPLARRIAADKHIEINLIDGSGPGGRVVQKDVLAALARALKLHPQLNATFDAQNNEITRYGDVNLGIAVALPDGLIVPVLRGVDQMGLKEIRQRSVDIVDRARAQRLKQDELRGATF